MVAARKPELEPLLEFCRGLPGVTEDVKWEHNLVFSVGEKMFCVFDLPEGEPLSFKADEGVFEALSQQPGIRPAPYLAKHFWVQLASRETLPLDTLEDLIEGSHALVASKLAKRLRRELGI